MLAKLPIKTHTHKFKKHRKCFVGREAVKFLIEQATLLSLPKKAGGPFTLRCAKACFI